MIEIDKLNFTNDQKDYIKSVLSTDVKKNTIEMYCTLLDQPINIDDFNDIDNIRFKKNIDNIRKDVEDRNKDLLSDIISKNAFIQNTIDEINDLLAQGNDEDLEDISKMVNDLMQLIQNISDDIEASVMAYNLNKTSIEFLYKLMDTGDILASMSKDTFNSVSNMINSKPSIYTGEEINK